MICCGAVPNSEWVDVSVNNRFKERYFHLHRDCGAKVFEIIQESELGINKDKFQIKEWRLNYELV
ncbi:hypothetical protein GW796_00015 [archaeon]|nr:hypothetical protein [archaeon]